VTAAAALHTVFDPITAPIPRQAGTTPAAASPSPRSVSGQAPQLTLLTGSVCTLSDGLTRLAQDPAAVRTGADSRVELSTQVNERLAHASDYLSAWPPIPQAAGPRLQPAHRRDPRFVPPDKLLIAPSTAVQQLSKISVDSP
jgi:hypothetical protein